MIWNQTFNINRLAKITFLSSIGSMFHLLARCFVTSILVRSLCPIVAISSIAEFLCSWQNWKNGFAGLLGAFLSTFVAFLLVEGLEIPLLPEVPLFNVPFFPLTSLPLDDPGV